MMAKVFFSYSHEDEALRDQLEKHLASLKHEGTIDAWYDRRILPGENIDAAIDAQIDSAEVVLLLVSASFLSSHYCYSVEMQRALARHAKGECKVVPVILRACDWSHSPLGKLLAVPKDGKPITSWTNPDEAYTDVVRQIRTLIQEVSRQSGTSTSQPLTASASVAVGGSVLTASPVRSSNLRLRKEFTDFDKDQFAHDSFDYIRRFFENSLSELQARNTGIQGTQRNVSESRFTASIYRDGRVVSECAIAIGADFGRNSITYAGQISSNGYNEILSVESDDQQMFFTALMGMHGGSRAKLGPEGVAELLWENLLQRLQR
jgi:hypothetical protein